MTDTNTNPATQPQPLPVIMDAAHRAQEAAAQLAQQQAAAAQAQATTAANKKRNAWVPPSKKG